MTINMRTLAKKVIAENSWGDVKLLHSSETAFILEHFGAEEGDKCIHIHEVEHVVYNNGETEMLDVLRLVNGTPVYHLTIVLHDETEWDENVEFPYGFIDINSAFSGDVDCCILAVIEKAVGITYRQIDDRSKTLTEKLEAAIEAAKRPSFEDAIRDIIAGTIAEGPGTWDDEDENNK
jgi:hypothetical protein